MSEFYFADSSRKDTAIVEKRMSIDMELGIGASDFVIKMPVEAYSSTDHSAGSYLYMDGTEYGGRIGDTEINTYDKEVALTGDTWRAMLDNKVVCPPTGQDYKIVSGDVNDVIRNLIGSRFGSIFRVSATKAGVTISNYKIRYATILEAITGILDTIGYRLDIKAIGSELEMYVLLSAVPSVDHSGDVETSQDSGIDFVLHKSGRPYNYMICAGRGELSEREIVYLHMINSKTFEQVQSIPDGVDIREYFYDYASAESRDALIKDAKKKFKELNANDSQELTIETDGEGYHIGDIIGGRDYITGKVIKEAITQKIIQYSDGKMRISYKVGE